jgi:tetratricopeptide (TPR) repeat protein
MKYFIIYFSLFYLISGNLLFSQIKNDFTQEISNIKDSISEIRRDQLNYKIEKDLLRETFSSNFQTINIVLTIVLGVFSLIGVFGIRNINSIKKDYENELKDLKNLSFDFELKIDNYKNDLDEMKNKYVELNKTNEIQNQRIKLLELQEKISSLIKADSFTIAMDYISIGLDIDSKNVSLLNSKGLCLIKASDLYSALATFKICYDLEPNNLLTILNLLELYLLLNQIDEYDSLYKKHQLQIASKKINGIGLNIYFDFFKAYQNHNYKEMKNIFSNYINDHSFDSKLIGTVPSLKWDFTETNKLLSSKPNDNGKTTFSTLIKLLDNKIKFDIAKVQILK